MLHSLKMCVARLWVLRRAAFVPNRESAHVA